MLSLNDNTDNCSCLFGFSHTCSPITVIRCLIHLLRIPCVSSSIAVFHLSCHPPVLSLSPDICCNSHLISCLFICLPAWLHSSLFVVDFFPSTFFSFLCRYLLMFPDTLPPFIAGFRSPSSICLVILIVAVTPV